MKKKLIYDASIADTFLSGRNYTNLKIYIAVYQCAQFHNNKKIFGNPIEIFPIVSLKFSGEAFDELTDADYAYDEDYESSESSATDALNITSTTNKVPSELTAVTKTIHIENLPAKG